MSKIESIIEPNNAKKPTIQKYLQYLILVAKTNGKKNAIHEKPGSASSPYLPLKKAFTTKIIPYKPPKDKIGIPEKSLNPKENTLRH